MIAIKQKTFKKMTVKLIVSILALIAATAIYFKLSVLNILLLTIASPVLLWLFLQLVLPMLKKLLKRFHKDHNSKRLKCLSVAKKAGKQPFYFNNQRHTVFAFNKQIAAKIYNERIKPLEKLNPYKDYEYISKEFNNLNNEY